MCFNARQASQLREHYTAEVQEYYKLEEILEEVEEDNADSAVLSGSITAVQDEISFLKSATVISFDRKRDILIFNQNWAKH